MTDTQAMKKATRTDLEALYLVVSALKGKRAREVARMLERLLGWDTL